MYLIEKPSGQVCRQCVLPNLVISFKILKSYFEKQTFPSTESKFFICFNGHFIFLAVQFKLFFLLQDFYGRIKQ
jgi:hypothetical protein